MQYHRNAKTNVNQREVMKKSTESSRTLGSQFQVSHVTVAKWKKKEDVIDSSSRPHTIHYAVDKSFWRLIKAVRQKLLFTLDELVEALLPYIENLNRDNCYRILKVYHLNRLSEKEQKKKKKFATYKPGFIHIDIFYLPKLMMNGKKKRYYCFLAIDRATRLLFLKVYPRKSHEEAADFLMACLNFFPYRIHHILTDNGKEFTLKDAKNRWGRITVDSLFDIICAICGIKHRLTKVKHPWTNGLAERAIKTTKDHTIKAHRYQSVEEMIFDLIQFQEYHNRYRKLTALNRKTPLDVTMAWFVKEPNIFIKEPTVC